MKVNALLLLALPVVSSAADPKPVPDSAYVRKDSPPMLILRGTGDKTVSVEQSKHLAEACRAAGMEHELVIVEGAPHSFHLQPKEQDLRPLVLGFFDKHLKPAK